MEETRSGMPLANSSDQGRRWTDGTLEWISKTGLSEQITNRTRSIVKHHLGTCQRLSFGHLELHRQFCLVSIPFPLVPITKLPFLPGYFLGFLLRKFCRSVAYNVLGPFAPYTQFFLKLRRVSLCCFFNSRVCLICSGFSLMNTIFFHLLSLLPHFSKMIILSIVIFIYLSFSSVFFSEPPIQLSVASIPVPTATSMAWVLPLCFQFPCRLPCLTHLLCISSCCFLQAPRLLRLQEDV